MSRTWTCQRVSGGLRCGFENSRRHTYCRACGKKRPASVGKGPDHRKALDTPYEVCVERFGERCGICGRPPKEGKKLHRDHRHKGEGRVRGLLCFQCNAAVRYYMTLDWAHALARYLERAELDLLERWEDAA